MSADPKEILCQTQYQDGTSHAGGRLESAYPALALSGRLVGHFGAIVRVLVGDMNH